jgi:Ca2+-transporting ATPase
MSPHNQDNASLARSMGLTVLMLANIFLVQVNSSDSDYFIVSIKRLAKDKIMWGINLLTVLGLIVILYTPLNNFLKLSPLSAGQFLTALGLAAVSVFWYEIIKFIQKMRNHRQI